MRLLRLKINDPKGFRTLQQGFEVHFLREWDHDKAGEFNPYILAGPNGSGKSNIMEALAAIFYHIECIYLNYQPDSFEYDEEDNPGGFKPDIAIPDAFELEYLISVPDLLNNKKIQDNAHIKIEKTTGMAPQISWLNLSIFSDEGNTILSRTEVKDLLPKYILGYSSGENEILSLPFFKMRFIHFDEYKDYLIKGLGYSRPEGRLTFLDSEFSQAITLCNFLLQEKETLKPFLNEIGIEDIKEFRIAIRKYIDIDDKKDTEFLKALIKENDLIKEKEDEVGKKRKFLGITQNVTTMIDKLKYCSTSQYYNDDAETLYLDYWVNDATREAFKLHFGTAIELFQAFQILLTLNLYSVSEKQKKELYQSPSLYVNETVPVLSLDERIMHIKDFVLKKRGVKGIVEGKSLSDGEHQLMHSLGLCLIFKDDNCLILLDEPETHYNPDWRALFISRLRECFQIGKAKTTMREMLITTHTPFLISDSMKEYVLIFDKDKESNHVSVSRPQFETLGASINKITLEVFGKRETIGGYAEQKLNDLKKRFEDGADGEEIIDEINKMLGDSVEKVLFIDKVLSSRESK